MPSHVHFRPGLRGLFTIGFTGQLTWQVFSEALLQGLLLAPNNTGPFDVIVDMTAAETRMSDSIYIMRHAARTISENPRMGTVVLITRSAAAVTLIRAYMRVNPESAGKYQMCTTLEQAHAILENLYGTPLEDSSGK
jgi:hypothetical protein